MHLVPPGLGQIWFSSVGIGEGKMIKNLSLFPGFIIADKNVLMFQLINVLSSRNKPSLARF